MIGEGGHVFEITGIRRLSDAVWEFTVHAPEIARAVLPGQFLMVKPDAAGERIPLTFSDWDADEGWIRFIFMRVGRTTHQMSGMSVGDSLMDIVGPLGEPSALSSGRWIVVGGGVGTAVAYPISRALVELGADVTTIIGARNRDLLILEDDLRELGLSELIVVTDDGSAGEKGLVTGPLARLCEAGDVDHVFLVGPAIMMKFASQTTKRYDVPTTVSLNPIMVDGTGMCGACRCTVGGEMRFGCVDGPDFDGHAVDWEELMSRQRMFSEDERLADAEYTKECSCHP